MLPLLRMPEFLMDEKMRKRIAKQRKEDHERRMASCVPWDEKMKWEPELNIIADTYEVDDLFPKVKPLEARGPTAAWLNGQPKKFYATSPCREFRYFKTTLKAGAVLSTVLGSRRGSVLFDGEVTIPALWRVDKKKREVIGGAPWMSMTPMEIFSLRPGTRLAKGHTIVAGLGLGHQLSRVCRKRSVKKVTLIERSQGLVDWILPRLELSGTPVDVVVGDAWEELPKLKADVALIDVFPGYGSNELPWRVQDGLWKRIGQVWCWGSAPLGDDGYW